MLAESTSHGRDSKKHKRRLGRRASAPSWSTATAVAESGTAHSGAIRVDLHPAHRAGFAGADCGEGDEIDGRAPRPDCRSVRRTAQCAAQTSKYDSAGWCSEHESWSWDADPDGQVMAHGVFEARAQLPLLRGPQAPVRLAP